MAKVCTKCGATKDESEFYGHNTRCKLCTSIYNRQRWADNPGVRERQQARKQSPEYRAKKIEYDRQRGQLPEVKEQKRITERLRYANNPDYKEQKRQRQSTPEYKAWAREYARQRYANDPEFREKQLTRPRRRRSRNLAYQERERARQSTPEYKAWLSEYLKRPEVKDSRSQYRKTDEYRQLERQRNTRRLQTPERREFLRISACNRRARKRAAEGSFTKGDVALMLKNQKGRCWYCQKDISVGYHVDHRVPLSRGGTNWPSNLVLACPHCNLSKHDKLPHEWNGRLL
jgi:5-methylcytosine-specific restriction endonuclease McrA